MASCSGEIIVLLISVLGHFSVVESQWYETSQHFQPREAYFEPINTFKEQNCEGETQMWTDGQHSLSPDWDNQINSFTINGSWAFYEHENFNEQVTGVVEYYFSWNWKCINLGKLQGRVSSFRYLGDSEPSRVRLYFIQYVGFQGSTNGRADADKNIETYAQSMVITGLQSWTVYDGENGSGNSYCLHPETTSFYQPRLIPDFSQILPSDFQIRSVKIGCFPQKATTAMSPFYYSGEPYY